MSRGDFRSGLDTRAGGPEGNPSIPACEVGDQVRR